jgi:hypothetical protein
VLLGRAAAPQQRWRPLQCGREGGGQVFGLNASPMFCCEQLCNSAI